MNAETELQRILAAGHLTGKFHRARDSFDDAREFDQQRVARQHAGLVGAHQT
jgi:hypothetical protein